VNALRQSPKQVVRGYVSLERECLLHSRDAGVEAPVYSFHAYSRLFRLICAVRMLIRVMLTCPRQQTLHHRVHEAFVRDG
jgi:hypothetical protein